MSLEKVPLVTQLLRASRDGNEVLLKEVFRHIWDNGITKEDLNTTDNSGRTAISYICSTNLTMFLDQLLKLPGIDVNKADNEGNTPLHFAAQAGQADAVNLLITKSRSLIVDAKNNLGFTPLHKAALQGRTKCAKLLLFAGASPVEIDSGRGLRPDQWARFCGRHTCADMIETYARTRLMERSTSNKWSFDLADPICRSKTTSFSTTTTTTTGTNGRKATGFYSKFRKVFPFRFASRDKNHLENLTHSNSDMVNVLGTSTFMCSTAISSSNKLSNRNTPTEVPKLEITYANNHALIKKYERIYNSDSNIDVSYKEDMERTFTKQRTSSPQAATKQPSYRMKNRK